MPAPANSRGPSRRQVYLAAALLVGAGILAYANSLTGAFVFDDLPAIRDNVTIRRLWPPLAPLSPPANTGIGGRPLANLSFALNYATTGLDVRGFHVGNLLLHLGSTLVLLGLLRRTPPFATQGAVWPAAAALLWCVHPLGTAAVNWLSQRTELLMGFLYLFSLYAFLRGAGPGGARGWLAASVAACALGMLSKEVIVTAPVLILLYDRTFVAGSCRAAWSQRRSYYLALAGTWAVLGCVLTTGLSQRSVGFGLGVSALDYGLIEARALLHYLRLAIWPTPLVFDYGPVHPASIPRLLGTFVVLALLVVWTVRAVRRRSPLGFAAAGCFVLLAPTSSFVPVAEQPMAENRMYLPLAALVSIGVSATAAVPRRPRSLALLAAAAALALGTAARNRVYHSEIGLWADTVRKRPENPRAAYNCGICLLEAGRPGEAVPCFQRAIERKPRDAKFHHSLGNALLELGRPREALVSLAEAVRLNPNHAAAWYNYGTALLRSGEAAAAIERFSRAVQLAPDSAPMQNALGNACFQLNRLAEAIAHYEAAVRLDPTLADAHYNGGSACLEAGRLDEAIAHFAAAARLKPHDAEVHNNHGAALLRAGRIPEAIAAFETALRVQPNYADARDNLAVARAASESARK